MRTHPRISVAASALVRYVRNGGFVGASSPVIYIREFRRLRWNDIDGAWALAQRRMPDFIEVNNDNFFKGLERKA
jgi:hypothetical protein